MSWANELINNQMNCFSTFHQLRFEVVQLDFSIFDEFERSSIRHGFPTQLFEIYPFFSYGIDRRVSLTQMGPKSVERALNQEAFVLRSWSASLGKREKREVGTDVGGSLKSRTYCTRTVRASRHMISPRQEI